MVPDYSKFIPVDMACKIISDLLTAFSVGVCLGLIMGAMVGLIGCMASSPSRGKRG